MLQFYITSAAFQKCTVRNRMITLSVEQFLIRSNPVTQSLNKNDNNQIFIRCRLLSPFKRANSKLSQKPYEVRTIIPSFSR